MPKKKGLSKNSNGNAGKKSTPTASTASGTSFNAHDLLEKAEEYLAQCQADLANQFCSTALQLEPDSTRALECKALALIDLNRHPEARPLLEKAAQLQPDIGASKYMVLGQVYDGVNAVQAFTKGIEIMTAEVQRAAHTGDAAAQEAAGEINSEIAIAFCGIAEIYLTDLCDEENAQEACTNCVKKALEFDPESYSAMQTMASISISACEPAEALDWMNRSLALWHNPNTPEITGEVPETGEPSEARMLPPFDQRISAAKILLELHQLERAIEVLLNLQAEDDEVVEVWYLLGFALHLSKSEDALETLCNTRKLYRKLLCEQEVILEHIEVMIAEYDPNQVQEAESLLAGNSSNGAAPMDQG